MFVIFVQFYLFTSRMFSLSPLADIKLGLGLHFT